MRDLIRYAAVRNVEIIPELDLPGHSRNFARVHPEILCDYTPDLRPTAGYDYRSVWCASREENLSAAGRYSGRAGGALPVGVPPYRRRRGRHEPMGEVPELSGTHGARGNGRRTCAGTVLSGKADPHSRSQRQASRLWNEAIEGGELARSTRVHGWGRASRLVSTPRRRATVRW